MVETPARSGGLFFTFIRQHRYPITRIGVVFLEPEYYRGQTLVFPGNDEQQLLFPSDFAGG
jgi:hypothetical protein